MLIVERDENGAIVAIRKGQRKPGLEPASLLSEEILTFLKSSGEIETFSQLLTLSDSTIVRVLEDLVDLLIEKKLILFTELPLEAQEKLRTRKKLRKEMSCENLMVDDIL